MTKSELKRDAINLLQMMAEKTLKMQGVNRGEVKHRCMFRDVKIAGKRWLADRGMIELRTDTTNGDGFAVTPYGLEYLDATQQTTQQTTQQVNEIALVNLLLDSLSRSATPPIQ